MENLLNEVKQYRKEQAELLDWHKHNGHPITISFDEGGLNACDKIIAIIERAKAKADSTSGKDLPGMQSYNQAFNDGIEAAAENAKLLSHNKSLLHLPYGWEENEHTDLISGTKCTVSKESILKLKKP